MKKLYKYLAGVLFALIVCGGAMLFFANRQIEKTTGNFLYNSVKIIPHNKVGLLLGTSRLKRGGFPNEYFNNRIDATVELYNAGKIEYVVISGDNRKKSYNEPQDMKEALLQKGIPASKIFLDYAGFRTYDSVYRINHIFGQTHFTIISQEFHNQRAVFIANKLQLAPIAFNAKEVDAYMGFKTKVREKFARVRVFFDLWTQTQPKFLGEKIIIP